MNTDVSPRPQVAQSPKATEPHTFVEPLVTPLDHQVEASDAIEVDQPAEPESSSASPENVDPDYSSPLWQAADRGGELAESLVDRLAQKVVSFGTFVIAVPFALAFYRLPDEPSDKQFVTRIVTIIGLLAIFGRVGAWLLEGGYGYPAFDHEAHHSLASVDLPSSRNHRHDRSRC